MKNYGQPVYNTEIRLKMHMCNGFNFCLTGKVLCQKGSRIRVTMKSTENFAMLLILHCRLSDTIVMSHSINKTQNRWIESEFQPFPNIGVHNLYNHINP